jgi:hypothetical protein
MDTIIQVTDDEWIAVDSAIGFPDSAPPCDEWVPSVYTRIKEQSTDMPPVEAAIVALNAECSWVGIGDVGELQAVVEPPPDTERRSREALALEAALEYLAVWYGDSTAVMPTP